MVRYLKTVFCIVLLLLVAWDAAQYSMARTHMAQLISRDPRDSILLDPGHGGLDSGAVSKNGILEKDINLAVALEIKRLAESDGWHVVMTRSEDKLLGSGMGGIRNMKVRDLKARKEIIDKKLPLIAVSIHVNSFREDPKVKGAQVFYPKGSDEQEIPSRSKNLAEAIQRELERGMDDGKEREAQSKGNIRILSDPKVPTVIVECGFLSNRDEAKNLAENSYQIRLAGLIYTGMMDYIRGKN